MHQIVDNFVKITSNFPQWKKGGCFNTKIASFQFGNSFHKDKTVSKPCYLCNGNSFLRKTVFKLKQAPKRMEIFILGPFVLYPSQWFLVRCKHLYFFRYTILIHVVVVSYCLSDFWVLTSVLIFIADPIPFKWLRYWLHTVKSLI